MNNETLQKLHEATIHSNYVENEYSTQALIDSLKALQSLPGSLSAWGLTYNYILDAHRILMENLNIQIAGELRDCDVWIGDRHCRFINHELLKDQVKAWVEDYGEADTYESIKEAHVKFERIHPFRDGNGRVGRLIMNQQLVNAGLDPELITVENRHEYYKWFE